jgi:hypothetical protein
MASCAPNIQLPDKKKDEHKWFALIGSSQRAQKIITRLLIGSILPAKTPRRSFKLLSYHPPQNSIGYWRLTK